MRSKGVLLLEIDGIKISLDPRWKEEKEIKKKEKELTPHEIAAEEFLKHQNKLNMIEGGIYG